MKKYSAEHAKAIISSYAENWIEFRDDGVHYSPDIFTYDLGQELIWKYVLELDGDDAPDPLTAPCLPFPFTAHELAAFMLDGIGAASIPANYAGSWESGPDNRMLESIGDLGRYAKRALCEAYAAIHAAEKAIGSSYPLELQKELNRLGDECTNAPLDKDLQKEHSLVEKRYQVAFATWRKAMVNWLLRPEASESIPKPTPAPAQAAGATAPVVTDDAWKTKAQTRAHEIIKESRERDLYPSQENLGDMVAAEFRKAGIVGTDGKPLSGAYIKRHALKGISSAIGKQLSTTIGRGK